MASLRKKYILYNLRNRGCAETPTGQRTALAVEDWMVLSLLRRVLGSLFGLLRTNFILVRLDAGSAGIVFGEFNRKFTILDRYVLDLTGDPEQILDRRVGLALGVMLDTGEGR